MLLAGSTAPLLAAFLALRRLHPRRPSRPRALPSTRPAQPARRSRPPKPAAVRGGAA
jgi:hypothetical protein